MHVPTCIGLPQEGKGPFFERHVQLSLSIPPSQASSAQQTSSEEHSKEKITLTTEKQSD